MSFSCPAVALNLSQLCPRGLVKVDAHMDMTSTVTGKGGLRILPNFARDKVV